MARVIPANWRLPHPVRNIHQNWNLPKTTPEPKIGRIRPIKAVKEHKKTFKYAAIGTGSLIALNAGRKFKNRLAEGSPLEGEQVYYGKALRYQPSINIMWTDIGKANPDLPESAYMW